MCSFPALLQIVKCLSGEFPVSDVSLTRSTLSRPGQTLVLRLALTYSCHSISTYLVGNRFVATIVWNASDLL